MSRKANVTDRIQYQIRKSDGNTYATYCPADRRHGGKDTYLGKVVDQARGVFYNKADGLFRFTLGEGKTSVSDGEKEYFNLLRYNVPITDNHLSIDFGDSWFLNDTLEAAKLLELFRSLLPNESDTLLSLIAYKLLANSANCYAEHWWEGNYAKYLYPKAKLESQRISEFLVRLGDEKLKRQFFDIYIPYTKTIPGMSENILIDSTGLPNDIQFDFSALNNHNGVISREIRLIYVVERNTGFPIYFRYVPGNIVDVSTLKPTLNLLKQYNIEVHHCLLDAGYSSMPNLKKMILDKTHFLTRLSDNNATKKYLKTHGLDVAKEENYFRYGERRIFMKRDIFPVGEVKCYAYIAIDYDRQIDEQKHYLDKCDDGTIEKDKNGKKKSKALEEMGYFVLLSSEEMDIREVLPLYYMRQTIEQIFDFAKNDVALLPLRTGNVETFRGHLMLSFMATIALMTMNQRLKTRKKLNKMCAISALHDMRFIKAEVFPNTLIPTESSKFCNLILNELNIEIPSLVKFL